MIKLVITDLDNTLYNWVDFYVPSFNAMIKELSLLTNIDERVLRSSFKRVHQRHRTTEYAFSIQELDVLAEYNADLTVAEILQKYDSAIKAFRVTRKKTLKLYDGVRKTLEKLRSEGRKIVGLSDAMMFYALHRIKQLGIEDLFDGLVAQRDHDISSGTNLTDVRYYDSIEQYETNIHITKELEPDIMKPNIECLKKILRYFDVERNRVLYVGDSKLKDIYMSQKCRIYDVYAQYGQQYDADNYRQLVEITHWTDEDVKIELKIKELNISPSFVISSFREIIDVIRVIEKGK